MLQTKRMARGYCTLASTFACISNSATVMGLPQPNKKILWIIREKFLPSGEKKGVNEEREKRLQ